MALLGDLRRNRSLDEITDLSYLEFAERLDPHISRFQQTGEWYWAHPWLNVLLPSSEARAYIEEALQTLSPDQIGSSRVVLLYPLRRDRLKRLLLQLPDDDIIFLFAVLRATPPTSPDIERDIANNRALYELAKSKGAKAYPIGAIRLTEDDWTAHFGDTWQILCAMKRHYDPRAILTPGHGIFGSNMPVQGQGNGP